MRLTVELHSRYPKEKELMEEIKARRVARFPVTIEGTEYKFNLLEWYIRSNTYNVYPFYETMTIELEGLL